MAGFTSLAAVGLSLERALDRCFEAAAAAAPDLFATRPRARLVRTDDFDRSSDAVASLISGPTLSIYCHRVEINRTMRAAWAAVGAQDGSIHLPLDLHFLLTAWDTDAQTELHMLGLVLQCLEAEPVLAGPRLHPSGGFGPTEAVQIVSEDLLPEDVFRTFDSLPADFRLSLAYVARVVRIDAPVVEHTDVVTAVTGLVPSAVG